MTKPSNMLSSQDVIERLCKLQERVSRHFKHRFSSDCFCGKGGQWLWNKEYGGTYEQGYRNSGYALKFIEHVVHRRLAQAPGVYEPRDWGFDPEEHSHQKVAERIMVSRQLWRRRALIAERKLRQAHAQDSDYGKLQGSGIAPELPAQQPMPKEQVYAIAEEVWDKYSIPAWQTLRIIRETERYHGIGKGESE